MKHLKQLFLAMPFILMSSANCFAGSEEKIKQFTTGSNKITVTQSGKKSSGLVIQQDKDGTKIISWGDGETEIKAEDDLASENEDDGGDRVTVNQKGNGNTIVIKQE